MQLSSRHTSALLEFFKVCVVNNIWQKSVSVLGLVMAAGCTAPGAQAQINAPAAAAVAASAAASDATAAPNAAIAPKYSAADIKTIFSYLDRNGDGKISKEEAASFKGVARNFDRADTNKDGALSFEEFEFAMNQAK